jgi:RNA polymerase sigma-32 factor
MPSPEADPAAALEREQWEGAVSGSLAAAIEQLDARSQEVIRTRWLAEDKRTLQDLADQYGVSAERIRQIESAALAKLRTALA